MATIMQMFRAFLSRQLGFPAGWFGRLLLRGLNRNNADMNRLVLLELALQAGDRVLEIGFGGGDLIDKILKTELPTLIFGVERSPDALKVCQERFDQFITQGKVELHLADAVALPFADHQFNQLCTVNTIYFWTDIAQVLTECHRVLQPGGKLVIGYRSKAYLDKHQFSQHGFSTYEVKTLEATLLKAGFVNIKTRFSETDHQQEFLCTSGIQKS